MYSRDVKFNEMEFGLGSGESSDYVELDVSSPTDEVQEDEVQEGELREDSEVGEGAATEQNVEESGVRRFDSKPAEARLSGGKGICCQG